MIFPQQGIRLGIEEVGVRIEHVQHARNCTVVDGFVRIHWLSVILLDDVIDLGELLQALIDIGVAVMRGDGILLGGNHSQESANCKK